MDIKNLKTYTQPLFIIFCCITAAYFAASATNDITKAPTLQLSSPSQRSTNAETQALTLDTFNTILVRNLLDVLSVAPVALNILDNTNSSGSQVHDAFGDIPLSTQPWVLLGTIFDENNQKASRAVLLIDGEQALYNEGESINNWEVLLVQRGSVILAQGAKRERLLIEGSTNALLDKPDFQRTLQRSKLQAVLRDIPTLMRALTVSPEQVGNRQGLRIVSIDTQTYLNQLSLQTGDILLALDNKPLRGFGDLAGFMTLVNNDTITLAVMRGGKETIIRYHMEK